MPWLRYTCSRVCIRAGYASKRILADQLGAPLSGELQQRLDAHAPDTISRRTVR